MVASMKRITYSGGSIVTGSAVTAALLKYLTTLAAAENSVTVDIVVLEDSGATAVHTLLLSPASEIDVVEVGGMAEDEEARRFPVPEFPEVGITATVERNNDASETAEDFNAVMGDIDSGLGHE